MLLQNDLEVDTDVRHAWRVLTDLEQIARCMPGATLDARDGDSFIGTISVSVGPITAAFSGTAHFAEQNVSAYRAVIAAAGKDARGQASASAEIRAQLLELSPSRTRVVIDTDLEISGRIAQFGRGAIADVSSRLLAQFADNVNELLHASAGGSHAVGAGSSQDGSGAVSARQLPRRDASVNATELVLPMIKERYGQAIAGALLGFLLSWLAFGRKVRK
jgi:carbon monoxide dehydrogenase subunit G